jgi:hypothetical protein
VTRFQPYDMVRISTDRFAHLGANRDSIAYVIERWPDGGLELELVDDDGSTIAQFVATEGDLELIERGSEER